MYVGNQLHHTFGIIQACFRSMDTVQLNEKEILIKLKNLLLIF